MMALGLVACLGLYFSLKSDLSVRAQHAEQRIAAMLERLDQAASQAASPDPQWDAEGPAPPYISLRSGMNLSRRTQALRLLRQGEDVSHVAAALAVPRGEIELLIRVQELMAHRAAPGA